MARRASSQAALLLLLLHPSSCVRDDWTYDARVDASTTEVAADTSTDVPAPDAVMDAALDVPALDVPALDVPADVLADAIGLDAPMDVAALDVTADVPMDVPGPDVPARDASMDLPTSDAPTDAPVDVPAVDAPAGMAPRPIAPLSLGEVTQRRPTLRWQLPAGFDGAVVELCRDRACTMVIETLTVTGSSARPMADLPARSVVFWRMRGRTGTTTSAAYSPTWLFHAPATSAGGGVDTSAHPHFDVNGDGYDDVVIAAKYVTVRSLTQMGAVNVFHGSASGVAATASRVLESPGFASGDAFGDSVACAGDLNGDGYADLVVGASGADPRGLGQAGAAYVFHGSASGVAATATRVLEGAGRGHEFGRSVAGVGDVNGDGYADLVVGAPYVTAGGRSNAGTASVFLGSAAGIGTTAATVLEGVAAGDHFGVAVAGAGDLNGDGRDDVVVGASRANPGGLVAAGTASVFHGGASGVAAVAARVLAGEAGDLLGSSVAGAGDVDGDGYDDLVVGAQRGVASVFHGGMSGIGATAARVLTGTDWNGLAVAGAGDVNGDGYADLVIGTSNTNTSEFNFVGSARVFQGSASGIAAAAARLFEGTRSGDAFGNAVASRCTRPRPGAGLRRRA